MKLRLPVALVCAAVALIALVAASPAPHSSTPGSSAPLAAIPSAAPSRGTFIIQVEQGSVLHLRGTSPCPAPPERLSGSTIVVKATIVKATGATGDSTASVVGSVSANGNWELQLPVPAEATLGLAAIKLTCIAGTDSVGYYAYPTSFVMIIKAPPTVIPPPVGGNFLIGVQRGSELQLHSVEPCPAPPQGLSASTIVVKAVILTSTDVGGASTASVVGSVSANGNWQLQLPVPAEATTGWATLKLTCIADSSADAYYTYPSSFVSIIKAPPPLEAAPAPPEPNWPPLLLLTLIGGIVLGRELPPFGRWPFGRVSAKASSEDAGADVPPDGEESGTDQGV